MSLLDYSYTNLKVGFGRFPVLLSLCSSRCIECLMTPQTMYLEYMSEKDLL